MRFILLSLVLVRFATATATGSCIGAGAVAVAAVADIGALDALTPEQAAHAGRQCFAHGREIEQYNGYAEQSVDEGRNATPLGARRDAAEACNKRERRQRCFNITVADI